MRDHRHGLCPECGVKVRGPAKECGECPWNPEVNIRGVMFGPKPGSWTVSSESDPRWNGSGRTEAMLFSAGLPQEVKDYIAEKTEELGDPPDDLEWFGMKD